MITGDSFSCNTNAQLGFVKTFFSYYSINIMFLQCVIEKEDIVAHIDIINKKIFIEI